MFDPHSPADDGIFAAQLVQDLAPEDLDLVVSTFRADVDRLTAALLRLAAAGDVLGFRRTAHALAGAAGAVGAAVLEHSCRGLMRRETLAAADLPPAAAALAAVGGQAVSGLEGAVARHLHGGAQAG